MRGVVLSVGGAIAAMSVTLLAASAATARGVVVDGSGGESSWVHQDICVYGGPACSGITLGFNIDVGSGLTNKVYVYDNGLVSIGAPLDALVNPVSSPSDLPGQNLFTPFVSSSDTSLMAASVPHGSPELDLVFGVQGAADLGGDNISFAELELTPLSSGNPGAFSLAFRYDDDNNPQFPDLTRAVWGYQFGGLSEQDTVYDFEIDRSFDLGSAVTSAVPEPSIWGMLLLGVGGVGAMLRSRSANKRAGSLI